LITSAIEHLVSNSKQYSAHLWPAQLHKTNCVTSHFWLLEYNRYRPFEG